MFIARALTATEAHIAFALVSCRYPALALEDWVDFVRRASSPDARERLFCLVDSRNRHHALFSYAIQNEAPATKRLRVRHIATFQLIGDAIHHALHDALNRLAGENGCREAVIEAWTPCEGVFDRTAPSGDSGLGRVLTIDTTLSAMGSLN